MSKTEVTKSIQSIQVGQKDSSGNKIIQVLAKNNEFAIYEIDTSDINNRLRVTIDGHTDQSEELITERFKKIKQKYISAKGLLYRSSNFGVMKNRVAHALASALSSDTGNAEEEFETLITEIKEEAATVVVNRGSYLLPAVVCVASTLFFLLGDPSPQKALILIFGASLGGALSLLVTVSTKHFEEFQWFHYLMLGSERVFLANVAAAVAYALVQANLVLPSLQNSGTWTILSLALIAGFSEQLAPSLIGKASNK